MPKGDSCAKNLLWKQLQLYTAQNPISVPPGLSVILFLHEWFPAETVAMYFIQIRQEEKYALRWWWKQTFFRDREEKKINSSGLEAVNFYFVAKWTFEIRDCCVYRNIKHN